MLDVRPPEHITKERRAAGGILGVDEGVDRRDHRPTVGPIRRRHRSREDCSDVPDPALARRLWQRLELIHAVTYFSPEPVNGLREAGYKGFWMGYFAGRAAPLGPVGPAVVTALFYNFAPSRVARALPDAWDFAPPEAALAARLHGLGRGLAASAR